MSEPTQKQTEGRRQRLCTFKAQGKWVLSSILVWMVVLFSLLLMPVLAVVALILCVRLVIARHEWELLLAGVFVIGGLFVTCVQVNRSILAETKSFLPIHPRIVQNAHLLPAEETLMRASEIPLLPEELLRPAESQRTPPELLLRACPPDEQA